MWEEFKKQRRACAVCGRPLSFRNKGPLCPHCEDEALFSKVKVYIQETHATELEVARHFDIPLSKLHHWIQDGRIEYR
jgi:uncharacterized Zn finger protein (UPF0148 family)